MRDSANNEEEDEDEQIGGGEIVLLNWQGEERRKCEIVVHSQKKRCRGALITVIRGEQPY